MASTGPRLPIELILHVISCYVSGRPRAILSPVEPETKALLAFTLVCSATYGTASGFLRQHCVHLASSSQLRDLLVCLERPSALPTRFAAASLGSITALFLAPFGPSLDDLPTAIWVRELLCSVCRSLRRLVIDLPLRSLYPADDHLDVRRVLRDGFSRLTMLEEFVSVRDELYLDVFDAALRTDEAQVWTAWPNLRRLALYNVDTSHRFWIKVAGMPKLETLVLTRADGLLDGCVKTAYFEKTSRPLRLVLVNIASDQPLAMPRSTWAIVDPGHGMRVEMYSVPTSHGDEDEIELCQDWVKAGALRGALWEWEGCQVQATGTTPQPQ